jgi:hypothetical protein
MSSPGECPDAIARFKPPGIAEWLILSLPDEELLDPRMTKTVDFWQRR